MTFSLARAIFRYGLLLAVLASAAACARAPGPGLSPADDARARDTWSRFTAIAARAEKTAGPFRLAATLYYAGKEDSQRVTVYFWGNKERTSPLRLDILMGPGSVMAAAREDARGLFIHVPREKTVYYARERGFVNFGVPLPFALADLAALTTGRFAAPFIPENSATPPAMAGKDGALVYALPDAPLAGFLTLGPDGLPVAWNDGEEKGWQLTVEYWPDSTRTTPRKLHIRHPEGREATLIVRELAFPGAAFTPEQLRLSVPPGTPLAPLADAQ